MLQEIVGRELAGRFVDDLAALLKDDDAIGVRERVMHVVQGEHEGLVVSLQKRENIAALHAVQGRDRLVTDQDRPSIVERSRHRRALLLSS